MHLCLIDGSKKIKVNLLCLTKERGLINPILLMVCKKFFVELAEILLQPNSVVNTIVSSKKYTVLEQQRDTQVLSATDQILIMKEQG